MIVQPKERSVRVLNSFMYQGEPTKVGSTLVLANGFAHEMKHSGKVEFLDADPKPILVAPPAESEKPNAVPADRAPKPKEK